MTCKAWMIVIAFVTVPLAAQQPGKPDSMRHHVMEPGPMGQMMGESMMPQMGPAVMKLMLYTPQHLLARKDALGLTADQVGKLAVLRDATKTAHEAAQAEAQAHVKEMEQTANAPKLDTSALKLHFQAVHNAMGKAHWAMLASAAQARAVLTDAQLTRVQAWADSMQAWMKQHHEKMGRTRPH